MQFASNGPDIPNAFLQAHEDGQIVFFCGAGVSYPADLPGFSDLVCKIYKNLGTTFEPIEEEAFKNKQFDTTLHLLERRAPGHLRAVREALFKALQPKLRRKGASDTHAALLQLSRCRHDGNLRLVTTNFDLIFEHAAKRIKTRHKAYIAPMLPIPKDHHWNGLVYLHGRLPKNSDDESALQNLVLSSGDFGNAYLIEQWAARFVSELFHNYTVCFVGYSIGDPVLRYMMDALVANKLRGAAAQQAYAFASYESGQKNDEYKKWEAKSVIPILYETTSDTNKHSALHRTLKVWAEAYRDGITGKERIVTKYASVEPSASTAQDDFVGRMLWALSDKSGEPAKLFANFTPAPSLKWLDEFSRCSFRHEDLPYFGVKPNDKHDEKLCFSLFCRPAPYNHAPYMSLTITAQPQWDTVMYHLAFWLLRHLNSRKLLFWFIQQGGQIHSRWRYMVEEKLNTFAGMEKQGKTMELDTIRASSPDAIPSPQMRTLWRLLLNGRISPPWKDKEEDFYYWREQLQFEGASPSFRMKLRELFAPKVILRETLWSGEEKEEENSTSNIMDIVDSELALTCNNAQFFLKEFKAFANNPFLPQFLEEFQQLLLDALDLLYELGKADEERNERSFWYLPSISPHAQNRGLYDWVILIELLRDSWLAVKSSDVEKSIRVAQEWFELPYSTFKRLAFFAASYENVIESEQWVDWLLSNDAWWLWHPETKREVMRLLVLRGSNLTTPEKERLECSILAGPPCGMFKRSLDLEDRQKLVDHLIWLRLSKLTSSGITLGDTAAERLQELQIANPAWQLTANESDEFSTWMSSGLDPDYEFESSVLPYKRVELVDWFRNHSDEHLMGTKWVEICRKHSLNSLYALYDLSKENIYPLYGWSHALYEWSKNSTKKLFKYIAPLVLKLSVDGLQKIVLGVSQWLDAVSKAVNMDDRGVLLEICQHILKLSPLEDDLAEDQNGTRSDPVTEAINHQIGYTTEVIVRLLFTNTPNDNDGLPEDIKSLFTELCNIDNRLFRHGRVLLALQLIPLFRIDQHWTEEHLLPFFDWNTCPNEASFVWAGFLRSPRLFPPLLKALKFPFLNTSAHYADLSKLGKSSFVSFITYAAVEGIEEFASDDFRIAFEQLPQEALEESAKSLSLAPQGSGEQRANYWKNRIKPFWQNVWPKNSNNCSKTMAEYLAQLCIAVDSEFPDALKTVQDWVQPIEHPDYILTQIKRGGLCSNFPKDMLNLLNKLIDGSLLERWKLALMVRDLDSCLDEIAKADQTLENDVSYKKLRSYIL